MITTLIAMVAVGADTVTGRVTTGGQPVSGAAVWLEGAVHSEPLAGAKINQKNVRFVPHLLIVTKGSKVEFPNSDTVYHNVFAQFQAKKFDLGLYPKGTSKSVVFDKTGIVSVMCNIHAEMSAYVVIVDTPYYAITDRQGRYTISGVRAGTYVATVWHESGKTGSSRASVRGGSDQVDISISR